MRRPHGSRAIAAAFLANLGVAAAKLVAFAFTGSSAMLAEAIHSVADTGNQALLFLGGRLARRAPTSRHPFGYGRERYFWAFIVSLMLFALGSVFSIAEGVAKIRRPHPLESLPGALGVLIAAVVLEGLSLRTAVAEARPLRRRGSWLAFVRRTRRAELAIVLLEDFGALIGLGLALAALVLAAATGEPRWDGIGTLAIGILLGCIAALLAAETRSLLIGESATPENRSAILEAMRSAPHVRRVLEVRTQHLGPEELLVAARVELDAGLATGEIARAIDSLEARVRERVPIVRHIYVEPDLHAEAEAPGPATDDADGRAPPRARDEPPA